MLSVEKPPLDDDLLMHYGIKGMKWGRRKAKPTGQSDKSSKPKMSTSKKVAIAATATAGAAAAAYVLYRRGRTPAVQLSRKEKLRKVVREGARKFRENRRAPSAFDIAKEAVNPLNWAKPLVG